MNSGASQENKSVAAETATLEMRWGYVALERTAFPSKVCPFEASYSRQTRLPPRGPFFLSYGHNPQQGKEEAVLKGHTSWVRGVAFSPDGTTIATAGWDGALKLWDANSYVETASLKGHRSGLYCVAFSPDGSRLASVSSDKTIKIWDAESEKEKLIWDVETREKIQDALWEPPEETTHNSPGGRWLVSTESNNVVLVDLEFKNTPDEKAYRKTKASLDPF